MNGNYVKKDKREEGGANQIVWKAGPVEIEFELIAIKIIDCWSKLWIGQKSKMIWYP